MMLTLHRRRVAVDATFGELFIDGTFVCFTLEDLPRPVKEWGKTRIPAGRYRLLLHTEGVMAPRYARTYAHLNHRGMLHLCDVPGFSGVHIHVGNTAADTHGCVLVGLRLQERPPALLHSRYAYERLYPAVAAAIEGAGAYIEIIDEPPAAVPAQVQS